MIKSIKNLFWWIFAVVLIAVWAFMFFSSDIAPIEDTNGPDDYSLTTITDENIINLDMGAVNPIKISRSNLKIGGLDLDPVVDFSSKNFSGVYEVVYNNYFANSDVVIDLTHLTVDSGNFKMVVLLDDEIVGTIEPSEETISFYMEDVNGCVSVRIAGESAAYSFGMLKSDYDHFAHP